MSLVEDIDRDRGHECMRDASPRIAGDWDRTNAWFRLVLPWRERGARSTVDMAAQ